MESFTEEQVLKLKNFLLENAENLAKNGKISQEPCYPDRDELKNYNWTIITIENLGVIKMYFTSCYYIVTINGVGVNSEISKSLEFHIVNDKLLEEYRNQIIRESEEWFNGN